MRFFAITGNKCSAYTGTGVRLAGNTHHVFEGNRSNKKTLKEVVEDLKGRFGIKRVVFVADRGMLSEQNLETILDGGFDYLLSLPMRHSVAASRLLDETEGLWDKGPKASTLEPPAGRAKYPAGLEDRHKEVFEQLNLPFPKLKHLEPGAL